MNTREYTHYGQKVVHFYNERSYELILEDNDIKYEILPILSSDYRVIRYNDKYALCHTLRVPDDFCEEVLVFEKIPDDLDLDALLQDIRNQKSGEKPMEMRSKAKKLISEAINDVREKTRDEDNYDICSMTTPIEQDYESFVRECAFYIQGKYGYTRSYMERLPHYDVDEKFWNDLLKNIWD